MDKLELAIATDYSGESSRTEDSEHILKMVSQAGFTHIHWCHEWDGDYTYSPMKCSRSGVDGQV